MQTTEAYDTESRHALSKEMQSTKERVVVSVGGSLIVPDQIDTDFLTRFKALILEKVQRGFTFSIIAGGGKIARRYQDAAGAVTPLTPQDIDWIGIHATRLNAQLLRNIFVGYAHPQVVKNPTIDIDAEEPIIMSAGWQPGFSTDYCAVLMAKNLGATRLVNLSNIDYVYDTDPRKNPKAKKIEKISWSEFRKIIPEKWDPGLSSPFDPIAAKEAETIGLEVAIINGAKLEEFSNYLDDKPFVGTIIS
jgi:uridylate kinase